MSTPIFILMIVSTAALLLLVGWLYAIAQDWPKIWILDLAFALSVAAVVMIGVWVLTLPPYQLGGC